MCAMAVESFAEWLSQQTDRDDQVGALAATVVGDPQFPEHGDRSIYEGYFSSASEPQDAADEFARAWDEFESSSAAG